MMTWTSDELNKIGAIEEIQLSALKADGMLRRPVTIWVVRIDDGLYVRAVNGRQSAWFRSTQVKHAGHIRAGRIEKDVTFMDADPSLNDQIDAAYRKKYGHYSARIVNTVLTPGSQASTTQLVPR
jgi:hypothetical protein